MDPIASHVVSVDEVEEVGQTAGDHWGGFDKVLTPSMRPRGGSLGVSRSRVPPGHTMSPFHSHQREDEVFFVLSGRGVLRYGDDIRALRPGDCVSCPAGTQVAHQLANPFDEDLIYLAIGVHDPHEVCRQLPKCGSNRISLPIALKGTLLSTAPHFTASFGMP